MQNTFQSKSAIATSYLHLLPIGVILRIQLVPKVYGCSAGIERGTVNLTYIPTFYQAREITRGSRGHESHEFMNTIKAQNGRRATAIR